MEQNTSRAENIRTAKHLPSHNGMASGFMRDLACTSDFGGPE